MNCDLQLAGECAKDGGHRPPLQVLWPCLRLADTYPRTQPRNRTGESDSMRHEIQIRGNTRTVMQYAAKKLAIVRVLPGIAGCRCVTGPRRIRSAEFGVRNEGTGRVQGLVTSSPMFGMGAYVDLARWKSNLHRRKSRYIAINRRNGFGNFFKHTVPGRLKMRRAKCKIGNAERRVGARGLQRRHRFIPSRGLAPHDSTPGFAPKLRRDKPVRQVVRGLISRRLRRKRAIFDPFLTCKGVDFPPLTKILPDFFADGLCAQYLSGDTFLAKDANGMKTRGTRVPWEIWKWRTWC